LARGAVSLEGACGKVYINHVDPLTGLPSTNSYSSVLPIAHETGHFKLHKDSRNEVTAIVSTLSGDPIDSGAGERKASRDLRLCDAYIPSRTRVGSDYLILFAIVRGAIARAYKILDTIWVRLRIPMEKSDRIGDKMNFPASSSGIIFKTRRTQPEF
jgi:hypothetical protein